MTQEGEGTDPEIEAEAWYNAAADIQDLAERRQYYEEGLHKGPIYRKWRLVGFASLALEQGFGTNEAGPALNAIMNDNPDFWFGWYVMARILGHEGEYEAGIATLNKVVMLRPGYWTGWYFLGAFHAQLHHTPQAIAAFERARDLKPNDPKTLSLLAGSYLRSGRATDAIACYRSAVLLLPTDPDLKRRYFRAVIDHNFRGNLDGAQRAAIRQANLQNPDLDDHLPYFPNSDLGDTIFGGSIDITHPPGPDFWDRERKRDVAIFRHGNQILMEEMANGFILEFERLAAGIHQDSPAMRLLVQEMLALVMDQGGVLNMTSLQQIANENQVAGGLLQALSII